jgi:hypothetical protein
MGTCWGADARWQVGCFYIHLSTAHRNIRTTSEPHTFVTSLFSVGG